MQNAQHCACASVSTLEAKMRKTILTLLGSVPTTRTHFIGEVSTWQFGDWIGIGVVIATELIFLYVAFN